MPIERYLIVMDGQTVNYIAGLLAERPYKETAALIQGLKAQCVAQEAEHAAKQEADAAAAKKREQEAAERAQVWKNSNGEPPPSGGDASHEASGALLPGKITEQDAASAELLPEAAIEKVFGPEIHRPDPYHLRDVAEARSAGMKHAGPKA